MQILVLVLPENTELSFTARPIVKARPEREPIDTTGEEAPPPSLPGRKEAAA